MSQKSRWGSRKGVKEASEKNKNRVVHLSHTKDRPHHDDEHANRDGDRDTNV